MKVGGVMTSKAQVSIALCTYNGEAYLREQLDSIVAQTYENLEVIAVDDNSNDNTIGILKDYASVHPFIKVYRNEENLGFLKNFEKAICLCNGQFIALCDQDDIWHPEKIALQVRAIGENMFVYHDSELVDENGKSLNKKMSDLRNFYRGSNPAVFVYNNCVSGHTMLVRRELFEYALPVKHLYHDWWFAYVATNIGSIDYIPQCLVKYRQHATSSTDIQNGISRFFQGGDGIDWELKWLREFAAFQYNRNQRLIDHLLAEYEKHLDGYLSFGYSILLYRHLKSLFYISQKSYLSKCNFIRKKLVGKKLRELYKKG